jgi:uncharacterized protein YdeI (BOF family)
MYFSPAKSSFNSLIFLFLAVLILTGNVFAQRNNSKAGELVRGQAAINKLSNRLSSVARTHGKSADGLRRLLLEDATLHVDETDKLLYIDDAVEHTESFTASEPLVSKAAPYSYSQTFALHSRPGSNRVIYLDFDGYVTSNTAWNNSYSGGQPINSAAFSIDGDPTTFTAQEQDVIQYVWQRVAEDYAAFDVDVTTQEPGDDAIFRSNSSDSIYGTRVVISPTNFTGMSIGGVAYVGVFNYTGSFYKPAFVMSANLGNNAKNIAEATSHEVGHNLGLDHDGTSTAGYYSGHGDWAPIMGVGYYKSVTQWSKGEYTGANNQQDDLAIVQNYGIPVIADDYGSTISSATALSGTSINVSGLITTRTDVDVFKFSTGSGNVTINLSPASLGANLDIEAKILDSAGNVIAVSNPTGLAASFNQYLNVGTYYLAVDGVGAGDLATGYSDYASIGRYSIAGTLIATNTCTFSINSTSANVTAIEATGSVELTTTSGCSWTATSNASSWLSVTNNLSGTSSGTVGYLVAANTGGARTGTITIAGQTFTVNQAAAAYNISGSVIYGITSPNQTPSIISGVSLNASGASFLSAVSDASGAYQLLGLTPSGDYTVTQSKTGEVNGINSLDATRIQQHRVGLITLTPNQLAAADTDGSGTINSLDATRIQQRLVGITSQNIIGQWKFVPGTKQYNSVNNNLTGENYQAVLVGEVSGNWSPTSSFADDLQSEEEFLPKEADQSSIAERFENEVSEHISGGMNQSGASVKNDGEKLAAGISVSLPANAAVSAGSTVTIPVTIGALPAGTNIESFDFTVFYDRTLMQPVTSLSSNTGTLSADCSVLSNSPIQGRVIVSGACANAITTGSGVLYNLQFNMIGSPGQQSGLLFSNPVTGTNMFQFNNASSPADTTDGLITIFGSGASSVSVSGRVTNNQGRGIGNVTVTMIDSRGNERSVQTTSFGYYRFDNIMAGETVTISAKAKRFKFIQPSIVRTTNDSVANADFVRQ